MNYTLEELIHEITYWNRSELVRGFDRALSEYTEPSATEACMEDDLVDLFVDLLSNNGMVYEDEIRFKIRSIVKNFS